MIELEALRAPDPRAYGRSSDRLPTLGPIKHDHGTYSIAPKRCMHCFSSAVRGAGEWSEYPTYSPSPKKKGGLSAHLFVRIKTHLSQSFL